MAYDLGGFGFISFDFFGISATTPHARGYRKAPEKQMKVHPSRWQEEERLADLPQSTGQDIRPTVFSTNNRAYRLSTRPCLESIEEQECQIDHAASEKFNCVPFRLCSLGVCRKN